MVLYTDYWASVLGLQGIVKERVIERGVVDPGVFRSCLNRPETRLPGLRYSLLTLLLGPVLIPYRMAQRIASKLHVPRTGEEEAERLLDPYKLGIEPEQPGRVNVGWRGERLASGLLDPQRCEVVFSLVYPTYKILAAAFLAIAISILAHVFLQQGTTQESHESWFRFVHYPVVVLLLFLIFRDAITALVAPLPVYLVVWGLQATGSLREPQTFAIVLIVIAMAYFIVDGFLVPRGLPPTLYLYVNDPESPIHTYEDRQAPTWLEGHTYWVWRFMYLTTAELNKFWERDWERVEVWVRADGPQAGQIDWVVLDFHYRELWLPREKLVSKEHASKQVVEIRDLGVDSKRRVAWMVEVDMNLVFHSPELRGLFLMPLEHGWKRARVRQLVSSLRVDVVPDRARDYREAVRRMLLAGHDLVSDIPEHFRGYALRQLLTTPWRYWRYARGADSAARPHIYSRNEGQTPPFANEPELQIKAGQVPTLDEIAGGVGRAVPGEFSE